MPPTMRAPLPGETFGDEYECACPWCGKNALDPDNFLLKEGVYFDCAACGKRVEIAWTEVVAYYWLRRGVAPRFNQ